MNNDTHSGECVSPEDMVNASELREFLFCERAWFLSSRGFESTAKAQALRAEGIAFHEARAVAAKEGRSTNAHVWALLLAVAAIALLIATLFMGGPMTAAPLIIAAALLIAAAFILVKARHQRRLGGLPEGELVYADMDGEDCPVLVSARYGIKGKPDALVRTPSGGVVPVERKKASAPRRPYDGDLIQAAAYCVLVEELYGQAPPFMRIQYADRWFDEPHTPETKQWVLRTCERLRQARRQSDCSRSHRIAAKCRNCGQRPNCGQAL